MPLSFSNTQLSTSTPTTTGRGYFHAEGSHSLENFVNSVTKDIIDPETKMSVCSVSGWLRSLAQMLRHGRN